MVRFSILRRLICPSTGLVVHGRSRAGLHGREILPQPGSKPGEQRVAGGGEHIMQTLIALSAQHLVQPLGERDRLGQLRGFGEKLGHKQPIGLGQRLGIGHQHASETSADGRMPSRL